MTSTQSQFVGRYAPSPTGDLHLGNLRTALLAWLQARLHQGRFLLRMEDIDKPRVVDGSAEQILRDLEWLGLDWDGDIIHQSQRLPRYRQVLQRLTEAGLTYPCFCSRKDIQQAASAPHGKPGVYPGTCANLSVEQQARLRDKKAPAIRLRVDDSLVSQKLNPASAEGSLLAEGSLSAEGSLKSECGDFVIHRADGLFAYQLAVVVDDLDQGVTDVLRGEDLASSTARQRYLAKLLVPRRPPMRYWHAPLMFDESGQRMSKRDGSESAREWRASGRSAAELIGHLAHSLGWFAAPQAMSATELCNRVTLDQLNTVLNES